RLSKAAPRSLVERVGGGASWAITASSSGSIVKRPWQHGQTIVKEVAIALTLAAPRGRVNSEGYRAGGALGNPIGLSGPPPAGRLPVRLSRRTTTGFRRPHPPRPPSPRCSRSDRRLAVVGQFHESPSLHASAARAPRGGRERRVSLRKPVVVRSD